MKKKMHNILIFVLIVTIITPGVYLRTHRPEMPSVPTPSSASSPQAITGNSGETTASGNDFETQYYQHLQDYFKGEENGYENMYVDYGREVE